MATRLRTFRHSQRSIRRHPTALLVGLCVLIGLAASLRPARAQTPTPTPLTHFDLQLTTNRGCFETGQNPVFVVGESITVTFRVGSTTVSQASATLFDILANGFVGAITFGHIPTNQTRAFAARVAPPTGVEQLLLKASAPGVQTTRRACSFLVVAAPTPGTPPPTRTPTATATPTSSPQGTATGSPTPNSGLSAEIHTDRGCLENGDHPVFAVGERIVVSFRIGSAVLNHAQASILDFLSNGFVNVFSLGVVSTNATFQFAGRVTLPTGVEMLQLRAKAFGFQTAVDSCSFLVVAAPPVTPSRTRTPTATRTPTNTRTPTVTATPTDTP